MRTPIALRRTLSLPMLVLYGLGTTIGAGIYALTGAVAGSAGMLAFASFGLAALLAGFTAASYAELSSRYPFAAAQAVYMREGFGTRRIASLLALGIALAGAVSAATVTNGFYGYLGELVTVPRTLAIVGIVALLGAVAALGVRESVGVAAAITAIEVGGLLLVIAYASPVLAELPARIGEFAPRASPGGLGGVFAGSFLAFYAFLGFEDMVNVGEEVRDARRALPLAIALTLAITLLLYVLLAVTAVLAVAPERLAASDAPLAFLFAERGGRAEWIGAIGVLAMLNGALIQILMASRILYGLARDGDLPQWLSSLHPRTRTPVLATALVTAAVAALALLFPLATLAEATSLITLISFACLNAALTRIQRRRPADSRIVRVPSLLPWAGLLVSAGFVAVRLFTIGSTALHH